MTAPAAAASDADRLMKLWEAYRAQEGELKEALARLERMASEVEGRGGEVRAREQVILEKDAEIRRLRDLVSERDERIGRLEALEEDVKAVETYKERIAQLEAAYAQEKERLAKLFLLYEQATGKERELRRG